jgi:hypothetical protein
VDAEADRHPSLGHGEESVVRPGQGAAAERDADRTGALICQLRYAGHAGEVVPGLCCCGCDAKDGEIARDSASLVLLGGGGTEDVVGHRDRLARDALRTKSFLGGVEIEDVAGVVAVREEDAATAVRGRRHGVHLVGRR